MDAKSQIVGGLEAAADQPVARVSNTKITQEMEPVHDLIGEGRFEEAMDELGQCEDGCMVEPDGHCEHGLPTLGLRMGFV